MSKIKLTLLFLATMLVCSSKLFAQTLTGEALTLEQDPGSDQGQGLTPIKLIGRGLNGNPYAWNIYTASIGGGYGVRPNAFEVWEYPPYNMNSACCIQRFSIDRANPAGVSP